MYSSIVMRRSISLNTSKTQSTQHQDLSIHETPLSLLGGDQNLSINKILSRDSSFGQSSRNYYTSTTNIGVPFQWEKKPGTPIFIPREDIILQPPPPPPPPAVQSLVLRLPNVDKRDSSLSGRFWLWRRRLSKNMRIRMYDRRRVHSSSKGSNVSSSDGDLDGELVGWINDDSKSLSSSSICLNTDQFESFRKGVPFCCATWRRCRWNKN